MRTYKALPDKWFCGGKVYITAIAPSVLIAAILSLLSEKTTGLDGAILACSGIVMNTQLMAHELRARKNAR